MICWDYRKTLNLWLLMRYSCFPCSQLCRQQYQKRRASVNILILKWRMHQLQDFYNLQSLPLSTACFPPVSDTRAWFARNSWFHTHFLPVDTCTDMLYRLVWTRSYRSMANLWEKKQKKNSVASTKLESKPKTTRRKSRALQGTIIQLPSFGDMAIRMTHIIQWGFNSFEIIRR